MRLRLFLATVILGTAAGLASAQTGGVAVAGPSLRLTKITRNLISSPNFTFTGAEQYQTNLRDRIFLSMIP